jgi:exodeoxyribonuclease V alpha subunit
VTQLVPDAPDRAEATQAFGFGGLLGTANRRGVLGAADLHTAATLGRLTGETDETVQLVVALLVRAVRDGAVCIEPAAALHAAAGQAAPAELPGWPDAGRFFAACERSPLVAVGSQADRRPVRLVDRMLYLERYWQEEELVRRAVAERAAAPPRALDHGQLRAALQRLFPGPAPDRQRLAAAACATGALIIVAGGPGTGKTTTVARMIALIAATWPRPPRVGLAAPTGKAAARLQEAFAEEAGSLRERHAAQIEPLPAATLHRLLGRRPDSSTRFRHNHDNRLPYDLVVVDETSMVSLTMMARLLEALRDDAALVLVGDPDQLASVDAGAVLGDLVHRPVAEPAPALLPALSAVCPADLAPLTRAREELSRGVVRLQTGYRFGKPIAELADAIRGGSVDQALAVLASGAPDVEWAPLEEAPAAGPGAPAIAGPAALAGLRSDVQAAGVQLTAAARAGDAAGALAALDRHRLLCAHRHGPHGVEWWTRQVEAWLAQVIPEYAADGTWYRGRPLLVTANDYDARLYNGDTGVVIDAGAGAVTAVFGSPLQPQRIAVSRLPAVQTVHAMTVHRAQGSQFDRVTVLLPPQESPLLTRELFYTAVTRAQSHVRVVASRAAVVAAVTRPIVRASGLRRLGG